MKTILLKAIGRAVETISRTQLGFIGVQAATIKLQHAQIGQLNAQMGDVKRTQGVALEKLSKELTRSRLETDRLRKLDATREKNEREIANVLRDAEEQQAEAMQVLSFDSDPLGETLPAKARRRMREYYEYKNNPLTMVRDGMNSPKVEPAVLRAIQRTWDLAWREAQYAEGRYTRRADLDKEIGKHEADALIDLALRSENGNTLGLPGFVRPPSTPPADSESIITTGEPS